MDTTLTENLKSAVKPQPVSNAPQVRFFDDVLYRDVINFRIGLENRLQAIAAPGVFSTVGHYRAMLLNAIPKTQTMSFADAVSFLRDVLAAAHTELNLSWEDLAIQLNALFSYSDNFQQVTAIDLCYYLAQSAENALSFLGGIDISAELSQSLGYEVNLSALQRQVKDPQAEPVFSYKYLLEVITGFVRYEEEQYAKQEGKIDAGSFACWQADYLADALLLPPSPAEKETVEIIQASFAGQAEGQSQDIPAAPLQEQAEPEGTAEPDAPEPAHSEQEDKAEQEEKAENSRLRQQLQELQQQMMDREAEAGALQAKLQQAEQAAASAQDAAASAQQQLKALQEVKQAQADAEGAKAQSAALPSGASGAVTTANDFTKVEKNESGSAPESAPEPQLEGPDDLERLKGLLAGQIEGDFDLTVQAPGRLLITVDSFAQLAGDCIPNTDGGITTLEFDPGFKELVRESIGAAYADAVYELQSKAV